MDKALRFIAGRDQAGWRLDEALQAWLPSSVSRSRLRSLILAGAVQVDGRPVRRPAWTLRRGSQVRIDLPAREEAPPPSFTADRILFEDEDLVAVDKPARLAMHANLDPRRPHLVGLVEAFLAEREGGEVRLGIHQRLDLDTSGVVVFTRSRRANPGMARLFEARAVKKTYRALAARPTRLPPGRWTETRGIEGPSRKGGPVRVLQTGGTPAETSFVLLEAFPRALLVQARPVTGRKHQVRAHLAAAGLPLLGDRLYGGPVRLGGLEVLRPMLHASRLELPHPVTGKPLVLECPDPDDFAALLESLEPPRSEP